MISRLTTLAVTFSIFATASLAFAARSHQEAPAAAAAATKQVRVVQLETVVITAKRVPHAAL